MNDHRVYAGLGPRFLAFIIDLILVNLVAGVFFALAWSTIVTAGGDGAVLDRNVLFTWNVRDIGRAAFMALYFAVFTRAFGGTVGKLWLGIHVVTPEGERIGFGTALYRETVGRFSILHLFPGISAGHILGAACVAPRLAQRDAGGERAKSRCRAEGERGRGGPLAGERGGRERFG